MSSPQRYSNGVTNVASDDLFSQLIIPDPTSVHTYFEDFNIYRAADFVITTTEGGSGDAAEALQDEDGGVLLITNDDADNDLDFFQLSGDGGTTANEIFAMEVGKKAWFKARFKTNDATQTDILIGLTDIDTTFLDASDGIWFQKSDGVATLDFKVAIGSAESVAASIATLANDTYVEVGFYYDGKDTISYYIDNVKQGDLSADTLPTGEVTISFGIQNGEAVVKTMSLDFIYMAKER